MLASIFVVWEESTPRYTQLKVSLQSIPLSCLTIGLDIGLIQDLIVDSLLKLHSGAESNKSRINVELHSNSNILLSIVPRYEC